MAYYVAVWVLDNSIPGPAGLFFVQETNTDLAAAKADARTVVGTHIGYSSGQIDAAYAAGKIISDIANPNDVLNPQIIGSNSGNTTESVSMVDTVSAAVIFVNTFNEVGTLVDTDNAPSSYSPSLDFSDSRNSQYTSMM